MLATCGGHWLVLQSVAWSGMIVKYARTEGLASAVEKTFDGRHPCGLCAQIAVGKRSEQKRAVQVVVSKVEFCHLAAAPLVRPAEDGVRLAVTDDSRAPRAQQPPVPPPRRA